MTAREALQKAHEYLCACDPLQTAGGHRNADLRAEIAALVSAAPDRLSEEEPVAWRYRWKIDGEWTGWHVSNHSQSCKGLRDLEERPLYTSPRLDREKVALLIMNVLRRKYGLDDLDLNTLKKIKSEDGIVEAFAIADAIIRETR